LQPGRHERLTGGKPSHKSIDQGSDMQALIAGAVLVLAACAVLAAGLFCGICGRSRAAASDGREIQSRRDRR
jgi:hypothetical protein